MKIPDAYFAGGLGQQIAKPAPVGSTAVAEQAAETIGRAGQVLGGSVLQAGLVQEEQQGRVDLMKAHEERTAMIQNLNEQAAEQKRLKRETEKSAAMTSLVAHENTLQGVVSELAKDQAMTPDEKRDTYRQQADKVKESFLSSVPDEYRTVLNPAFDQHRFSAETALNGHIERDLTDQSKAHFLNLLDELKKNTVKTLQEKVQILDEAMQDPTVKTGFSQAELANRKQQFVRDIVKDEVAQRLNTEDPKKLMEMLHTKDGADGTGEYRFYKEMDPSDREAFYGTAKARYKEQQALLQHQRTEAERLRREAARDAFDLYKDAKENLRPLTPADEAALLRQMNGTPFGKGADIIRKQTSGIDFQLEKISTDPLTFGAAKAGLQVPPLDANNPAAWPQQLAARAQLGAKIKTDNGLPYLPLLTAPEAKYFGEYFKDQSPQGIVRTVEQLKSIPGMQGESVKFMARQFAQTNPGLGTVVALTADGKSDAAFHVANGLKLVKEHDIDKAEGLKKDLQTFYDKNVADALDHMPQMKEQMRSAVNAAYYSMAANKGLPTSKVDKGTYAEAVKSVVGGTVKVNGRFVVLPSGVPESAFKDFRRNIDGKTVEDAGGLLGAEDADTAAETVRKAQMVAVGEGRYRFLQSGRYLMQTDGKTPLQLEIGVHGGAW